MDAIQNRNTAASDIDRLRQEAERGSAKAQFELGNCYYSGNGVVQDFETAAYWYGKAAEHGDAGAKSKLNLCMEHIWEEAERDVASAQDFLGSCYEEGNGVKKDRRMAIFWYWNAARNASGGGKYHLSRLTDGTDVAAAVLHANKHGAVVKTAAGQYALGTVFARQKRISVQREAIKLFQSAAAQGNAEAQLELARRLTNGDGIQKDQSAAAYWYLRAAEQDNATAQNVIGVCYELGQGVISNRELAAFWYWNAARNGDSYGEENMSRLEQQGVDTARALLNAHLHQAAVKTAAGQYALGAAFAGQDSKTMRQEAMKLFLSAAKQGYGKAQLELGRRYACGEGVEKDLEKAVFWFQKAANRGDAEAQYNLGDCYYNGEGVEKDLEKAVFWFQKAAEQGHAEAQNKLGDCYYIGRGVEKDHEKAVYWYQKAAEQGNATAQCNLGSCYHIGLGVTEHRKKAFCWYEKAAEQGHAEAQYALGSFYQNGDGVEKDLEKAVYWYEKAAVQGNEYAKYAQFELGVCYEYGKGVQKDAEKALYWYQKAAEQGNAEAQNKLGNCYYNGEGVAKDLEKAVFWFQKAAKRGNAEAKYNLGIRYYNGEGVEKDLEKAVFWFQKAADKRHTKAPFKLGNCYYNGEGVEKDLEKAVYWYERAAARGNAEAPEALTRIREKERQRLVAEEAEHKRILEEARQRCLDEQVPVLVQTFLQSCKEKATNVLPPLPEVMKDCEAEWFYQQAQQAEDAGKYPQAILFYGWAAQKGSRSAGYNIVNMSAKNSLYFLERPQASERR